MASDEYKEDLLINRIRIKMQLKKAQKLCYSLSDFEEEFCHKVGISLLKVENERWSKELSSQNMQTTEQ